MKPIALFVVLTNLAAASGPDESENGAKAQAEFELVDSVEAAIGNPNYVLVPGGTLTPRSCVTELPEGAVIDESGEVSHPDGHRTQIPKCPFPVFSLRAAHESQALTVPSIDGWVIASSQEFSDLTSLYENFTVPHNPSQPGGIVFFFPAIATPGKTILQPVLEWNNNDHPGIWIIRSWYVFPNAPAVTSRAVHVFPGDSLWGGIERSDCRSDGTCRWAITTRSRARNLSVRIDVRSLYANNTAFGGALEAYNVTSCHRLPSTEGEWFTGLQLFDGANRRITPHFTIFQWDTNCRNSAGVNSTATTIHWDEGCLISGSSCDKGPSSCCSGTCAYRGSQLLCK